MDVHLRELLASQDDLVARWQLTAAGWSRHAVSARGWRPIHDGVYAAGQAPLTQRGRWMAATLTAPGTVLAAASAAACLGFRPWEGRYETGTRPGDGGPRRLGSLLVTRSTTLAGNTTRHAGLPTVTAARALIDLAAHLDRGQLGRGSARPPG